MHREDGVRRGREPHWAEKEEDENALSMLLLPAADNGEDIPMPHRSQRKEECDRDRHPPNTDRRHPRHGKEECPTKDTPNGADGKMTLLLLRMDGANSDDEAWEGYSKCSFPANFHRC